MALLKLGEEGIVACDNVGDLFDYLNRITERLWSADKLIHVSLPAIPSSFRANVPQLEQQLRTSITDDELARKRSHYASVRQSKHELRQL